MLLKNRSLVPFALKSFTLAGILLTVFCFSTNVWASTIAGTVYDHRRNALPDVDVELLDDLYRQIARTRTDSTGRYEFTVNDGNYTVKVMPFRYDLLDQSMYIEVKTLNAVASSGMSSQAGQQGNAYFVQDFYLAPRKGGLLERELGVVFAQSIPKEAEKLYDQAIKHGEKNRPAEAEANLREAVRIFPEYYLALNQLGTILTLKGEYGEAVPILLKAAEINEKSPTTLFYLGLSLYKLNYNKAAITALSRAYEIAPASPLVLYYLGAAERAEGKFTEAEEHLLKAKKLSSQSVPDIHWELAELYGLNLKKYKEAAEELEKYLKARKHDEDHIKKIKKLIADFKEKANAQASND